MGWTLSPKTTPPAAWVLMATGYAGSPCSGAGQNGTIRTARASGVLWPDHSPARRLPRPRGVTPQAGLGRTCGCGSNGCRTRASCDWHLPLDATRMEPQGRAPAPPNPLHGQLVSRGPLADSDSQPRACCTGTVPPRVWFARLLRPAGPDPSRSGSSTTPAPKWVAISVPH